MKRKKNSTRKDPPNLKRYRESVEKLSHMKDEDEHFQFTAEKKIPRKQKRRWERQLKKARKNAFNSHKPMPLSIEATLQKKKDMLEEKKQKKKDRKKKSKEKKKEIKEKEQKNNIEKDDLRKRNLIEENKKEDKIIKQLEKQMGLNKRKGTKMPKGFIDDGLDYLLEAVDSEKLQQALYSDGEDDMLGETDELSENESKEGLDDDNEIGDSDSDNNIDITDSDDALSGSNEEESTTISRKDTNNDKNESKGILKSHKKTKNKKSVSFSDSPENDILKRDNDDEVKKTTKRKLDKQLSPNNQNIEDDYEDEILEEDNNLNENSYSEEEDSGTDDDSEGVVEAAEPTYTEDIYGRLRDEKGNIIKSVSSTYVLPARRFEADPSKKVESDKIKKQLKGLINRASESNMESISKQIEALYRSHSRAMISDNLTGVILGQCLSVVLIPERLIMELTMLVSILHSNVGSEVGAHVIQKLAHKFNDLFHSKQGSTTKEMDNVLVVLCQLYNFKVVHCLVIYDIIKKLIERFSEKDIEVLLLMLKNVGFSLRKDDPTSLKDIIVQVQTKAASVDVTQFTDQSRVRFMLDTIMAIKNNNMRKIPNYDPEHLEHLKKLLRNYIKSGSPQDAQLRISLEDLLNAEGQGRWWIVGSAWTGKQTEPERQDENLRLKTKMPAVSDKILELAQRQRMNTDVRKNIFCIIMTSEDFAEAFEQLVRLGLKSTQEREIVHVIVDCCLQEKAYNPYYSYLLQKFCELDRRFKMTFQFNVWDKFKEISKLSQHSRTNMASLLVHLISTKAVTLSIFKVIEFSELDQLLVKALRDVMIGLLQNDSDTIQAVFSQLIHNDKLSILREGLLLFLDHFMLQKKDKLHQMTPTVVRQVDYVKKILATH